MADKFITRFFYASLEKRTVIDVQAGALLVKRKEVEKDNPRYIAGSEYAEALRKIYVDFDAMGYDVINIVPLITGGSEASITNQGSYLGDVGFSITRGAVAVGKRRGSDEPIPTPPPLPPH